MAYMTDHIDYVEKTLLTLDRQYLVELAKQEPSKSITFGLITVGEHESHKVRRLMDLIKDAGERNETYPQ